MAQVRESPRVSVNRLGEYLVASPAGRKRIIHEQKHPCEPQYLRYPEASLAITEFLCGGLNAGVLRAHLERFAATPPRDDFDAQRLRLCAEAVDRFAALVPLLEMEDAIVSAVGAEPPVLQVAGVDISVRPEVVLQMVDRKGNNRVGLLKLYFSKHHPLDERSGRYIATLLQSYAEQHLSRLGPVEPRLVRVVDVFAGTLFCAPRANTRRLSDVRLACEEIAERWALH
jgi:hypothetical protein